MRLPCRRTALLTIATGAAIVLTAGTASAYWSSSGTGHGTVKTGVANGVSVDPGTPSTGLVPGGTADIAVVLSNPGPSPLQVTSVTTPGGGAAGYSDPQLTQPIQTCDATRSGVTPVRTTSRPASFVIAAHGSYTLTLTGAVTMSNSSDNSCQGVYFAVPVTVQAQSAAGGTASVPATGTL